MKRRDKMVVHVDPGLGLHRGSWVARGPHPVTQDRAQAAPSTAPAQRYPSPSAAATLKPSAAAPLGSENFAGLSAGAPGAAIGYRPSTGRCGRTSVGWRSIPSSCVFVFSRAADLRGVPSLHIQRSDFSSRFLQNFFLDFGGGVPYVGTSRCDLPFLGADRAAFAFRGPACRHSGWITRLGRTAMRQNALLQSVKGLEVPSTARKKARHGRRCRRYAEDRDDHFVVRNGVRCAGAHLIVDLHGATASTISTLSRRRCGAASRRRSATLLHIHLHTSSRTAVSGRGGAGGEPHLHPHLARDGLCGVRRVHVRRCQPGRLHSGAARGLQAERIAVERIFARARRLTCRTTA